MNVTTKRARFAHERSVQALASSFGGGCLVADLNETILPQVLALRTGVFLQRTDTWRDFGKVDTFVCVSNVLKSPSTGAVFSLFPWLGLYANASKSFVVIT